MQHMKQLLTEIVTLACPTCFLTSSMHDAEAGVVLGPRLTGAGDAEGLMLFPSRWVVLDAEFLLACS